MGCTLVNASISLDSHHLVNWSSAKNQAANQCFKARKNDELQRSSCCDMRALIITEQLAPASLRLACTRPLIKKSNSSKSWDSSCEGDLGLNKYSQSCIFFLCFGFLLCISFIFALCTVDASITTGNRSPQERKMSIDVSEKSHHKKMASFTHAGTAIAADTGGPFTHEAALHGLGIVFTKGTKPMENLIVANLEEYCDMQDLRLFLRTLYRSGAMSRADLVLLFPWPSIPQPVSNVLLEEDLSFRKLVSMNFSSSTPSRDANISVFNALAFERASKINNAKMTKLNNANKNRSSIIWGDGVASKHEGGLLRDFYFGSVVGFQMNELDPNNGFAEFLINPSSQLRRWLCYQMLLGVLRHKFKQVMLVDLGGVVILGDVFANGKKREFIHLTLEDSTWAEAVPECNDDNQQEEDRQSQMIRSIQGDDSKSLIGRRTHDGDSQSITVRNNIHDDDDDDGRSMMLRNTHDDDKKSMMTRGTHDDRKGKMVTRNIHHDDDRKGRMVTRNIHHDHDRKGRMVSRNIHDDDDDDGKHMMVRNLHDHHRKGMMVGNLCDDGGKSVMVGSKHNQDEDDDDDRDLAEKRMVMRIRHDVNDHANGKKAKQSIMRRRRKGAKQSLMEMVYGKELWGCLEQEEKERRVVSSRVILGSIRAAKGLANSMAIEVVRVALQRNSKLGFPDRALLSYLVQKSSHLLGKKVTESLHVVGNSQSMAHCVDRSKQDDVFVRASDGRKYTVLQASSLCQWGHLGNHLNLGHLIRADICSARADSAAVYDDCLQS